MTDMNRQFEIQPSEGLRSGRDFFSEADEALKAKDTRWCLIAIDIEHFSLFNDWYGREKGDAVLSGVSKVLVSTAEKYGGIAGYQGLDDFCVLLPYDELLINTLYSSLRSVVSNESLSSGFRPVFGIALRDDGANAMDLFDCALSALSEIKENFHKSIKLYDSSSQKKSEDEYRMLLDFENGLRNGEIFFSLQPQCRISTGRIVGAECLARWRTKDGRMIPPDRFVPVLERYGFINDLDTFIWEELCKWMSGWIKAGHPVVPVSLNVSQRDIFQVDLPSYFNALLKKYDIPKSLIKLEFTESAYVEEEKIISDTVSKLREAGFLVLMDDFGSGYSSLNMLSRLNVDIVKLDAQFMNLRSSDENTEEKSVHVIESIVNMTNNLELPVIVEGVEDSEQVDFLRNLGCRYIQGFYYYRALSVEEFEDLLVRDDTLDEGGISFVANQQFRIRELLDEAIYSDTMLNNILGPTAFYALKGEHIDIVRFNKQFYELVDDKQDFNKRLSDIQQYIYEDDLPRFYKLFEDAKENRISGAKDIIGTYRSDGRLVRLHILMYYLGQEAGKERFYGKLQDVTEIYNSHSSVSLLGKYSPFSAVFVSIRLGKPYYRFVINAQRDTLPFSEQRLTEMMNDGSFFHLIPAEEREKFKAVCGMAFVTKEKLDYAFHFTNPKGEYESFRLLGDPVEPGNADAGDVKYVLLFGRGLINQI